MTDTFIRDVPLQTVATVCRQNATECVDYAYGIIHQCLQLVTASHMTQVKPFKVILKHSIKYYTNCMVKLGKDKHEKHTR